MKTDLTEEYLDVPPHGWILVLRPRERVLTPRGNAIAKMLMKYPESTTAFAGILIDLAGVDYQFSSADLGSVVGTIAAWVRGWVAPCSIVMTGRAADDLRTLLEITELNNLEELRVVDTSNSGLEHIIRQLERIKTDPRPRLT